MCAQCEVGATVSVRIGGDFYYDPESGGELDDSLLLIAGGVGINPLYSMLQHAVNLKSTMASRGPHKMLLMYSASSIQEFIFKVRVYGPLCLSYRWLIIFQPDGTIVTIVSLAKCEVETAGKIKKTIVSITMCLVMCTCWQIIYNPDRIGML